MFGHFLHSLIKLLLFFGTIVSFLQNTTDIGTFQYYQYDAEYGAVQSTYDVWQYGTEWLVGYGSTVRQRFPDL